MSSTPDAIWTDLAAAAARLGISPDATRKRLERGTLRGEKRAGRWYVWLPGLDSQPDTSDATGRHLDSDVDATRTPTDAPSTTREFIDQLKAENTYLREQLDQRSRELASERERFDVLHREALARIPALGAGQDAPEAAPAAHPTTEQAGPVFLRRDWRWWPFDGPPWRWRKL